MHCVFLSLSLPLFHQAKFFLQQSSPSVRALSSPCCGPCFVLASHLNRTCTKARSNVCEDVPLPLFRCPQCPSLRPAYKSLKYLSQFALARSYQKLMMADTFGIIPIPALLPLLSLGTSPCETCQQNHMKEVVRKRLWGHVGGALEANVCWSRNVCCCVLS